MPSRNLKKVTPSVRGIYRNLAELQRAQKTVTPVVLAKASGFAYSGEIGTQLAFLYDQGYVERKKIGHETHLSILKPLPEV